MDYIQGIPRDQLFLFNDNLDQIIEENNPVRVIDVYVDSLNMNELGFKLPKLLTGKPPYKRELFLKIYINGYLERIRTSRRLEKECKRNKEMIWLTEGLAPDFKTIADFRKDNKKALKNVFTNFLHFCNKVNLLTLEEIGIDGSKIRAQNHQNNVYKRDEIDTIKKKIEEKIEEYISSLDEEDKKESNNIKLDEKKVSEVLKKLQKLKKYKKKVDEVEKHFQDNPDLETYYATDPDCHFQSDKGQVKPGYNVQICTDAENKLIIVSDVTNKSNDLEQMTPMIEQVKKIKEELGINANTNAIMDAGYFNESQIMLNKDDPLIEIITTDTKEAEKQNKKKKNQPKPDKVPAEEFEIDNFKYDRENDTYICPEGNLLKKTHKKPGTERSGRKVFEYQCYDCKGCPSRNRCTKNKRGRSIKVSVNKEYIDQFKETMKTKEKKELMKKRKEIVEHPFGTLKRNWGFTYFLQCGIEKVKAEFSFMCFIYNFKRVINILGVKQMIELLS